MAQCKGIYKVGNFSKFYGKLFDLRTKFNYKISCNFSVQLYYISF